ncbi:Rne/Rng family ribonuclease [Tropicimonas sp. IMCC6043]|uniref:Rne/Rng family ribonuclease n=1 Tax=Tropicimonas sp. IMCC6043 TaxID=2510645 RepID=UPI00101DB875|nr:Rne/Rng family ribonuclease [Tropicimonas sp. IMCC6043]RYH12144.1 Rne/Rng family ribonuclease [Tropicimonas sp. IMCC6043]
MANKMLIDATHAEETRVVVVDGNKVDEFDFETVNKRQLAGNIYLAKVTRVEPSLQAAFVDYGGNRHGFLAFSEIHPDYYQIPVADREALLAEEREMNRDEEEEDAEEPKKSRSRGRRSRSRQRGREDAAEAETRSGGIEGMDVVDFGEESEAEMLLRPVDVIEDGSAPVTVEVAEAPVEDAPETDGGASALVEGSEESTDGADALQDAAQEPAADAPEEPANAETPDTEAEKPDTEEDSGKWMAARLEDEAADIVTSDATVEEDAEAQPDGEFAADQPADEPADEPESVSEDTPELGAEAAQADPEDSATDTDAKGSDEAESVSADEADEEDEGPGQDIESVAEEDVQEEIRRPRKPRMRRYKIQEVIKVRQIMLVQVVKEERGNKGAALTTYLSLAGRYCVLMPNTARGGGISRKITNAVDRKKLKEIASEIDVPDGAGLIIRTAGAKRSKAEIKRDYEYLKRLWEQIRELTLKSIAPAPIYEEGNLIKRSIRDLYNRDIDEVFVEGEAGYRVAKDFMKMIMPSHAKNVKLYQGPMPLFARYQVESYLAAMFNPVVQLKSGGYIVIGVTEALVAIDVNSGRATKEGSIEETALKTNLEAAEEVARQLRLRDLAGLIVIDFIDMEERKNNAAVEKRFKEKLKTDRARIQVGRISGFGLMEMSRQRLRPGMLEATTQPCPACHGTGLLRSSDSIGLQILRQLEEEGGRRRSREVLVRAPVAICNFLMNQKREHIAHIEAQYGMAVRVEADPTLIPPDFSIEKFKTATRSVPEPSAPVISVDTSDMPDFEEELEDAADTQVVEAPDSESTEDDEGSPKKKRRRRRRRRGGSSSDEGQSDESNGQSSESADEAQSEDASAESDDESEDKKPSRTRRRRSRRKKSSENGEDGQETAPEAAEDETDAAPEPDSDGNSGNDAPAELVAGAAAPEAGEAAPAVEEPAEASADDVSEQAVTAEEESPDAVTAAPDEAVAAETAEAEEVAVAEAESPAPEAAPDKTEPEAEESSAPKRRGWWSVGR